MSSLLNHHLNTFFHIHRIRHWTVHDWVFTIIFERLIHCMFTKLTNIIRVNLVIGIWGNEWVLVEKIMDKFNCIFLTCRLLIKYLRIPSIQTQPLVHLLLPPYLLLGLWNINLGHNFLAVRISYWELGTTLMNIRGSAHAGRSILPAILLILLMCFIQQTGGCTFLH